jgi:hypothetical protein
MIALNGRPPFSFGVVPRAFMGKRFLTEGKLHCESEVYGRCCSSAASLASASWRIVESQRQHQWPPDPHDGRQDTNSSRADRWLRGNWAIPAMSGLLPLATELRTSLLVRFVPIPDIADDAAPKTIGRQPRRPKRKAARRQLLLDWAGH